MNLRGPTLAGLLLTTAVSLFAPPATADDILGKVAAFDPTVRFGDTGSMTFKPLLQTRWTGAETGGLNRDVVSGFSVPRARLVLMTTLFERFRFKFRLGSTSSGGVAFEQAYGQANFGDCRIRVGQLPLTLNAGQEPAAEGLSTADYASYSNTYSGGQTQGIDFAYRGPVRVIATVGNGARSGFSDLLAPLVADIATSGRFEVPIGKQGADDYDSEASFRKHQPINARIGVTGHYQERAATASNSANDIQIAGADAGVRGSGFSILVSGSYLRLAQPNVETVHDAGALVLGSWLPARRVEVFAQFDAIWPLGNHAPLPSGIGKGQPGTTMFRTMTLGSNFFIVPDVHRLKIQVDLQTMFDGQVTSIIPANASLGVLSATGPQVSARVQLVVAL